MYGHTSRIWKIEQLEAGQGSDALQIASVSEDATCKIWSVNPDGTHSELSTLKAHIGKNVRALSAAGDFLATGGEDASVKLWRLSQVLARQKDTPDAVTEIRTRLPLPD